MKRSVKYLLQSLFSVAILILLSSFFEAGALNYGSFDYEVVGSQCVITDCDDSVSGTLTVPDSIDGYVVTAIGNSAFEGLNRISEIKLPETVKNIGDKAFYGCSNLISISVPDSVSSLGKSVFYKCNNLKNVTLSDNITVIPESCFYYCEKLENIHLSEKVISFAEKAFYGCKNLSKLVFPENTLLISASCFEKCSSLASVCFPEGLLSIGAYAFTGCTALSDVYYFGDYESSENLSISSGNDLLEKATWKFNHIHKASFGVLKVEATCTEEGYEEVNCVCGYYGRSVFEPAKGHDFSVFTTEKQADCKNTGIVRISCSRCDSYELMELPLASHKIVIDSEVEATCFSEGKTQGSHCYVCGEVIKKQETIPAKGHDYSEKIVDNAHLVSPATYTKAAVYRYSCIRCSAVSNKTYYGDKLVLGKTDKFISSSTSNSITLGWNRVAGADGYGIYYKNSQGKWKLYRKTTDNIHKISSLPSGSKYTFALRAYVVENGVTVGSPYYETLIEATRPIKPEKVTAIQNETAVKLSWSASPGATGYRVYGYNTRTESWVVVRSSTKTCSNITENLRSGVYYKFAVRPYIDTGSKIVWSESYTEIITATKPIPPVLKATSLKSGVRFEWNKVSGADGYLIYGSKSPNSGYVRLSVTTALTYTKSGLASGQNYYFKAYSVKKLNGGYVYSYAGDVKVVKTK